MASCSSNLFNLSNIEGLCSSIWNNQFSVLDRLNEIWDVVKKALYYICIIVSAVMQPIAFLIGFLVGVCIPKDFESEIIENIKMAWENLQCHHYIGLGLLTFFALPVLPYLVPFTCGAYCGYRVKVTTTERMPGEKSTPIELQKHDLV